MRCKCHSPGRGMLFSAQAAEFLPLNSQLSSLNAVFRITGQKAGRHVSGRVARPAGGARRMFTGVPHTGDVRVYSAGRGTRRSGRPPYPMHAVQLPLASVILFPKVGISSERPGFDAEAQSEQRVSQRYFPCLSGWLTNPAQAGGTRRSAARFVVRATEEARAERRAPPACRSSNPVLSRNRISRIFPLFLCVPLTPPLRHCVENGNSGTGSENPRNQTNCPRKTRKDAQLLSKNFPLRRSCETISTGCYYSGNQTDGTLPLNPNLNLNLNRCEGRDYD